MPTTGTVRVIKDTQLRGVEALIKRLGKGQHRVLVGVPAGKTEPEGTSMAMVAAINEFGGTVKSHHRASRETHFSEHAFRNKEGFDSYRFAKKGAKSYIRGRDSRAYTQEGYTIPARPFLRPAIYNNIRRISNLARQGLREVARGQRALTGALDLLGVFATGAVKREITSGEAAPNAPSTIKKKGSSRPRIDSGALRQGITHIVEGGRSLGERIRGLR